MRVAWIPLLLGCGSAYQADDDHELPVQWHDRSLEEAPDLRAVYSGGTGAWVAGVEGQLLRLAGGEHAAIDTGADSDILAMWGVGDGLDAELYLTTDSGAVLRYVMGATVIHDVGSQRLTGIDGQAGDLTAVGAGGTYRFRDHAWTYEDAYRLNAVWVHGDLAIGVGANGLIAHREGGEWSAITAPTARTLRGVHGKAPDEAWAVGDGGLILRWDGESWEEVASGVSSRLRAVWQAESGEVFVVGDEGVALSWDGERFRALPTGVALDLYAVYGTAANRVWAVGDAGLVLRYTGPVLPDEDED